MQKVINQFILNIKTANNIMGTFLMILSIILIVVGILITGLFFNFIGHEFTFGRSGKIDMAVTAQVGDFIGGIIGTVFSLAGFVMLLLTFRQQNDAFKKERFENRFFELVKFHKENTAEIQVDIKVRRTFNGELKLLDETYKAKKAFSYFLDQINLILKEVAPYFNNKIEEEVYVATYLLAFKQNTCLKDRDIDYIQLARINIAYLIFFFGLSNEGEKIIRRICSEKYKQVFLSEVLNYLKLKPVEESIYWDKWKRINRQSDFESRRTLIKDFYESRLGVSMGGGFDSKLISVYYNDNFTKYYGGNQFRLGHYYRHLFQTVTYVNEQSFLSFKEKYSYVKMLRAQLSTYEQVIFFFNSLSIMGEVWELLPECKRSRLDLEEKQLLNHQLITKYNLIKNIPGEHLGTSVKFTRYYPDVEYELSDITENKRRIKRLYK